MKQNRLRESGDKSASYFDVLNDKGRGNGGADVNNNNQNEIKDMETMEDQGLLAADDGYFEKKKSPSKVGVKNAESASKKERSKFFERGAQGLRGQKLEESEEQRQLMARFASGTSGASQLSKGVEGRTSGGYGSPARSRLGAAGNARQSRGSSGQRKRSSAGKRIQLDDDAPDDVTEDDEQTNRPPPEVNEDNHHRQTGMRATPTADDFGPPTYRDGNDDVGEHISGPNMTEHTSHRGNLQVYQTNRRTPLGSRPPDERPDRQTLDAIVNANKLPGLNPKGSGPSPQQYPTTSLLPDTPKIGLPSRGGNSNILKNQKGEVGLSAYGRGKNSATYERDEEEASEYLDLDRQDQPEELNRRKRHQLDEMRHAHKPSTKKGQDHGMRVAGGRGLAGRASDEEDDQEMGMPLDRDSDGDSASGQEGVHVRDQLGFDSVGYRYASQDQAALKEDGHGADHRDIHVELEAELKPLLLSMKPKNNSLSFEPPKNDAQLSQRLLAYYTRNTHLRDLETRQDLGQAGSGAEESYAPSASEGLVQDIRNVHVCSDHQRAYVWVVTWPKSQSRNSKTPRKMRLWLQVYSLASTWGSQNTRSSKDLSEGFKLQQLRDENMRLDSEFKKVPHVVVAEEAAPKASNKSPAHQNTELQSILDKARKDSTSRQSLRKTKKQQLADLEKEFYGTHLKASLSADPDPEEQNYHLVEDYEDFRSSANHGGSVQQDSISSKLQLPQKADFKILIGEFESPKHEYLHSIIQSYYKQYVSSTQALYFFRFEEDGEFEKEVGQLCPPLPNVKSEGSAQSSLPKTGPESESGEPASEQKADLKSYKQPVLYQLNAYSNKCERVLRNGLPIRLPIDADTNQFAIIRPMDPKRSRELSFLDTFMVAIMKEAKVTANEATDAEQRRRVSNSASSRQELRGTSKSKSTKKLDQTLVEVIVEIYQTNMNQPILGANVDVWEVSQKFKPKNISAHLKEDDPEQAEAKPVNQDVNFCCWYLIDQPNHNMNFSMFIDELQINMRTPYNLDPKEVDVREIQKRVVVAPYLQYGGPNDQGDFLRGFAIHQEMPLYAVELKTSMNFAQLASLQSGSMAARKSWQRQLGRDIGNAASPSQRADSGASKLQRLLESQEAVQQNLDFECNKIYITVKEDAGPPAFESVYPILPDYFWITLEGQGLRDEIVDQLQRLAGTNQDAQRSPLLRRTRQARSARESGLPRAYCQRTVNHSITTSQLGVIGEICQCLSHHQIYFPDSAEQFDQRALDSLGHAHSKQTRDQIHELIALKDFQTWQKSTRPTRSESGSLSRRTRSPGRRERLGSGFFKPGQGKSQRRHSARYRTEPTREDDEVQMKLAFEKLAISEDQQTFIRLVKREQWLKDKPGEGEGTDETINASQRRQYPANEEGPESFEYELQIGTLALGYMQQMIHVHEERDALRQTAQLLTQFSFLDGQDLPLQNPNSAYQQLLVLTDHGQQPPVQPGVYGGTPGGPELPDYITRPKREGAASLKLLQVCQRRDVAAERQPRLEALTEFKNVPVRYTCLNFHQSPELRRNYFFDALKSANVLNEVTWDRDQGAKQALTDYLAEQCKAKVWLPDGTIKTINFFQEIFRTFPKWRPSTTCMLDCTVSPAEPQSWQILRNLYIDKMNLVTLKQQRSDPRNVVLALRPRRPDGQPLSTGGEATARRPTLVIHLVGRLNETMETFEHLYVLRQDRRGASRNEKRQQQGKPLEQVSAVEIHNYLDFTKEFVDDAQHTDPTCDEFCSEFSQLYHNTSMLSFDGNFGDSFGPSLELFAVKCWAPHNSIKLYVYDFLLRELSELYELPMSATKLHTVVDLQLVRISDQSNSHVLYLDMNAYKEAYVIEFTGGKARVEFAKTVGHESQSRSSIPMDGYSACGASLHASSDYQGSLVGKFEILSPSLEHSRVQADGFEEFIVNHQVRIIPQYKRGLRRRNGSDDEAEGANLDRDGFSLLVDQARVDFDFEFLYNVPSRENIGFSYQNVTNVFEYERKRTKKIKANIHAEHPSDSEFFELEVVKLKFRHEILVHHAFSENQKQKLLDYFASTVHSHEVPSYLCLYQQDRLSRCHKRVSEKQLEQLLAPRPELYGANILTFKCSEVELIGEVLEAAMNQLATAKDNTESSHGIYKARDRKFLELDMNLMSPVSWALSFGYLEAVKKYIESFKVFAMLSEQELVKQHAPIFYSFVKQVLDLGLISLDEFLNPTQTHHHEGLQLFEITLSDAYLPAFHENDQTFTNAFYSNLSQLEAHLAETLEIDHLEHPSNAALLSPKKLKEPKDEILDSKPTDTRATPTKQLSEVQYSHIDMSWVDILNRFNQEAPWTMAQRQPAPSKPHQGKQFDFSTVLKDKHDLGLLQAIYAHPQIELLTCESVQILIDLQWNKYAKAFFDAQLQVYLMFFLVPFIGDLYMMDEFKTEFSWAHTFLVAIAMMTQVAFFFHEILQVSYFGNSLSSYVKDFCNMNDITCLPVYVVLHILVGAQAGGERTLASTNAVRVFYALAAVQAFIKLLFLLRVREDVAFIINTLQRVSADLQYFAIVGLACNALFASLFMILDADIGSEYDELWGPLKWMCYALRNGLHDYQVPDDGFVPRTALTGLGVDLSQGNGAVMYLTWIAWLANIVIMTIILFNLVISIMWQSYEHQLQDREAHVYKQKLQLVLEANQVFGALGMLEEFEEMDQQIIIRKKRSATGHSESTRSAKGAGLVHAVGAALQKTVSPMSARLTQQHAHLQTMVKQELTHQFSAHFSTLSNHARQSSRLKPSGAKAAALFIDDGAFSLSGEPITYNANANNVSH